jgi:sulfhydrogenase subunit beta (sulfur reductase)
MIKRINTENLKNLINGFLKAGKNVVAPVKNNNLITFKSIKDFSEIKLDYIQSTLSPKGVFFPNTDEILKFENSKNNVKVIETVIPESEVILFGIKPCDAFGLNYLSDFFLKENTDKYYKLRRDKTTIIGLSCKESDDFCFCTSVGLSPYETKGSDLFLTQTESDYYVEFISEYGMKIFDEHNSLFIDSETIDKSKFTSSPKIQFNLDEVLTKANQFYTDSKWPENSFSCYSCGACAFSCPTCSCYDLQDEKTPYDGRRLKNWDTCGIGLFTIHSSGHNPRTVQSQRWKHRIMHKFNYSVKNMDTVSCIGCGRCIRVCPGGMDIVETLQNLKD